MGKYLLLGRWKIAGTLNADGKLNADYPGGSIHEKICVILCPGVFVRNHVTIENIRKRDLYSA